ncbi:PDZ domain-containing protein [Candidatus Falkowbacteria bacterium]|nr:PDZ domain-containing protein [Candidatus Falkowbacteria bacterium]
MSESKKIIVVSVVLSVILSSAAGGAFGYYAGRYQTDKISGNVTTQDIKSFNEESSVISTVEKASPAVVSIIITKNLPKYNQNFDSPFGSDFFRQFFGDSFSAPDLSVPQNNQNSTEKTEVGGGSGFIVSSDGYVVTNKHVVADTEAEYTVLMNNEKKYQAKVLARDQVNDLAVLKIDAKDLPTLNFGDSSKLKVGQSVIAIGNALAEFRNTVSTGVISGLSRSIVAGGGISGNEQLSGVIQTDASINPGNSGGPLLDLSGQVIGINTAVAQGAQGIGFAIPINEVKNAIESVKKVGKIVRPWLGIRYQPITKDYADKSKLPVDYGALILRGQQATDLAVIPGSPADKAGLQENDIILELNGQKIDGSNQLSSLITKLKVGDEVTLKVMHRGQTKDVKVKLEEMK